ncbi:MAG: tetratricopeptide repeat protein [Desulfomicrobium escambiense]|nr:tetratricopeptide repeat protein [Desulfomicrobium escambiense]
MIDRSPLRFFSRPVFFIGRASPATILWERRFRICPSTPLASRGIRDEIRRLHSLRRGAPRAGIQLAAPTKRSEATISASRRQEEDYAEAVGLWTESVAYRPDDPEARYNLGAALVALKRYAEAETQLREAAALSSLDADAHYMLGKSLEEQGKLPEAKNAYGFALGIKPTHVPSLIGLASIALEEGQNRSAENHATQAVSLDPGNLRGEHAADRGVFPERRFQRRVRPDTLGAKARSRQRLALRPHRQDRLRERMYADALDALRSARALGSSTDELFCYLGLANLRARRRGRGGEGIPALRLQEQRKRERVERARRNLYQGEALARSERGGRTGRPDRSFRS